MCRQTDNALVIAHNHIARKHTNSAASDRFVDAEQPNAAGIAVAVLLPFDLDGAKKLLTLAGYPGGFNFQMNCQSDGLVNEEEFCQAVAAMWSRAGFKPNLSLAPRSQQSPKRVKGE